MEAKAIVQSRTATLVLGLGNPLRGDDGVGLAVIHHLKGYPIPAGTTVVDGGAGGLEVTLEFAGKDAALVIDAARFGGRPGEIRRFDLLAVRASRANWGQGHAHGLTAAIELGRALDLLPSRLVLFAIEPATLEVPMSLSPQVQQAIPRVASAIIAELTSMQTGPSKNCHTSAM